MITEKLCDGLASLSRDEWQTVKACMDAAFSGCYDSLYKELTSDSRFQHHGKAPGELYGMITRPLH